MSEKPPVILGWKPPRPLLTFVEVEDTIERRRLESVYGKVWNTKELGDRFQVIFSWGRYCAVREWRTRRGGIIEFTAWPRFYFNYRRLGSRKKSPFSHGL